MITKKFAATTDSSVPSDKPPKNPIAKIKTTGKLKHPLFKVGGSPGIVLKAEEPKDDAPKGKVLRYVLTCPGTRTYEVGKGKKATTATEPCRKKMSVYLEHGTERTGITRCCFCYSEFGNRTLFAQGHLVQEDLASVQS
jgi:hypothetical protein